MINVGDGVRHADMHAKLGEGEVVHIAKQGTMAVVYWEGSNVARTCSTSMLSVAEKPKTVFDEVGMELERASKHGEFNSAHEGYAIILEEMDELKEHVWMKQKDRNLHAMRAEAIQVAAMAVKFVQMIDEGRGQ